MAQWMKYDNKYKNEENSLNNDNASLQKFSQKKYINKLNMFSYLLFRKFCHLVLFDNYQTFLTLNC